MKAASVLILCCSTAFGLTTFGIPHHEYLCNDGSFYLKYDRCNGVKDCAGGEDEDNCLCNGQFACVNGTCIDLDQVCDGTNNCAGSEDEEQKKCYKFNLRNARQTLSTSDTDSTTESFIPFNPEKFRCNNGEHVLKRWICDFERDCADGSDEDPNICENLSCRADEFRCGSDGECIPNIWLCDGRNDCSNGVDESKCNETCRSDQFSCSNGRCIQPHWRCDSDNDCGDESDELNCPKKECKIDQFMCNNGKCIPQRWRCDREVDCLDNSDELNCTDSRRNSTSTQPTALTTEASTVESNITFTQTSIEATMVPTK